MRVQSRIALAAGLAWVIGLHGAPAAAADPAYRWAPVETGLRWVYEMHREKRRALNGAPGEIESFAGELEKEIVRPLQRFGIAAFEMRETFTGLIAGEHGKHRESKRSVVRPHEAGYSVLAEEINDDFIGERGLARFSPALRFLPPDPEPGATWHVGTAEFNGLIVDISAEALGFHDLETPAGRFDHCLKVRYTADVSGQINVFGVALPIKAGTNTSTSWYARDVGRVQSEEETYAVVSLATGAELELTQRLTYSLKEATSPEGEALPASPRD